MAKLLVNSLPKSGTHLLIKLLEGMECKYSGANFSTSTIYGRYKLPKYLLRGVISGQAGVDVGLDIAAVARQSWVINKLSKVGEKEFCTGHLPYSDNMRFLSYEAGLKAIHINRDPRDVLVSWAHYVPKTEWHYGLQGLIGLDLEQRVNKILYGYQSGVFGIESFSHVLGRSAGWLDTENVLVIKFEDLVGHCGGGDDDQQINTVEKVAEYVGVDIDVQQLAGTLFGGTKVFRKGRIGAWKEELSPALAEEVNSVLNKWVVQMGYKL